MFLEGKLEESTELNIHIKDKLSRSNGFTFSP